MLFGEKKLELTKEIKKNPLAKVDYLLCEVNPLKEKIKDIGDHMFNSKGALKSIEKTVMMDHSSSAIKNTTLMKKR